MFLLWFVLLLVGKKDRVDFKGFEIGKDVHSAGLGKGFNLGAGDFWLPEARTKVFKKLVLTPCLFYGM